MDSIKIEIDSICRGCLSFDRELKPLTENADLFFIMLGGIYIPDDSKYFNLLLCWECTAIFKRIVTYQRRFQKCQAVFHEGLKEPLDIQCLSSLNTFSKNDYDFFIEYDEIDDKNIEIKFNETVQNEVEHIYKEESCDSFCDNDSPKEEEEVEIEKKEKNRNQNKISWTVSKFYKASTVNYDKNDLDKYIENLQLSFKELENLCKDNKKTKCVSSVTHSYFKRKNSLKKQDVRRSNYEQGVACSYCKKVQSDSVSMKNHWDDHIFNMYKCIYCGIIMMYKYDVLAHLKISHKHIFYCQCGLKYYSKKDYNLHYQKFHSQYICDHCKGVFKRKEKIEKHMINNHLPNKCGICQRVYNKASNLRQHYYLFHSKREDSETTYCVECDLEFQNSYMYNRHLKTAVAHKPRIRKKVPCPDCGKIFSRKSYMTNHYNLIHQKRSKYYCELCNKYFANGYSIRTHKKFIHDKTEKPRDKICNICGKGFFTTTILNNHTRTHTGERPHQCSYCDSTFSRDTAKKSHERTQHKNTNRVLINHTRTHTGERPFQCSYCDSTFSQDTARKTHERTQHKNVNKIGNELK